MTASAGVVGLDGELVPAALDDGNAVETAR